MVNKEIEEMKKHLDACEKLTINRKLNLMAQVEEIQMRIRDIDEASEEFEENVVKRGINSLTGKIPAEKFVRFMEQWLKAADRIMDKLRLKSSTIKSQIKRAKLQLRQREELGEALHLIDFQVLTIENADYSKKIVEKTRNIMELKKITGRYNLELTNHKNKLNEQQIRLNNIKKEVNTKTNQIEKLTMDLENTRVQLEKMTHQMTHISKMMDGYEVKLKKKLYIN